jgi:hypothetical protein
MKSQPRVLTCCCIVDYLLVVFSFDLTTGNPACVHPFHPPRRAAAFLTP